MIKVNIKSKKQYFPGETFKVTEGVDTYLAILTQTSENGAQLISLGDNSQFIPHFPSNGFDNSGEFHMINGGVFKSAIHGFNSRLELTKVDIVLNLL